MMQDPSSNPKTDPALQKTKNMVHFVLNRVMLFFFQGVSNVLAQSLLLFIKLFLCNTSIQTLTSISSTRETTNGKNNLF
jgi:hypothetical protein